MTGDTQSNLLFTDTLDKQLNIKDVTYDAVTTKQYIDGYTGQQWFANNNGNHYFCRAAFGSIYRHNPNSTIFQYLKVTCKQRHKCKC